MPYNVDYYDVKRFDDGELTIHELVNSAFDPAEQVNAKQAELLGAVFVAAMGCSAHVHVGTGGGGSNSHSPWNDKDKKRGVSEDDYEKPTHACLYIIMSGHS